MSDTVGSIRKTKQFKAILAVLKDQDKALAAYYAANPDQAPQVEPQGDLADLMAAGLTEAQAKAALATPADAPVETPAETPVTSKDVAEALVAERGFTFTKGRVYATGTLAEAIVRVLKNGKPEIVPSSGVGRTKGVLVYKLDSGDVALQNLMVADA